MDSYVNALVTEIGHQPPAIPDSDWLNPFQFGSVFLGGGTPSLLWPSQIARILDAARAWGVAPGAEITIEANPDDPTLDYLQELRAIGVNRLSFGVQSFD